MSTLISPSLAAFEAVISFVIALDTDFSASAKAASLSTASPPVASATFAIVFRTEATCWLADSKDFDTALVASASGLKSSKSTPSPSASVSMPSNFATSFTVGASVPATSASSTAS